MPVSTVLSPISATHSNSSSSASAQLVLTFSADILAGVGSITISDGSTQTYFGKDGTLRTRLIGATDTRTIDITDTSKVSISGDTVTISLDSNLAAGKKYSVQMGKGVLLDENGTAYAGLSDTTKLQFTPSATPVPTALIDSNFALKYDTGVSNSDFITKTALQSVGGTYTGTLAAGEFIEVSLDNGGTWQVATVANDIWTVEGTLAGSSTIIARVSNAAGVHSAAVRHAYTLDTEGPALAESIDLSDADLMAGETATVTVTLSEAVTNLELADFDVTGGVLSNLMTSDDGITWTATLTPTANVNDGAGQVTLKAGALADLAGNAGPANDSSASFSYNTVPNVPDATVTSAFMTDTGASSTDFITKSTAQSVSGKYDGTLATDEYIEVSLDGGTTWTKATATAGNWSIPATTISASNTLKARVTNGYTYSNPLVQEYTLDQAAPTAYSPTLADSTIGIGETSLVTFTFSEAVTAFTNDDITVSGGTLSTVASTDGGITWTATFTPSASTTALTNAITVNNTGLTDIAGNAGSGSTSSANYAVDTVRPTVTSITLADSTLTAGETTTVTFSFSEVVTDLSIADIAVANGTLSNLTASDAGTIWTATLTPATSTDDTSNVITLDNTGVTDTAGNAGSGTTSSGNYTVNTMRPTVTSISVADTKLTAGETTTVTIVFSEAVTNLTTADLTVGNGTLSGLTSSDGITWTATLTPSAATDDAFNNIVLDNTGVQDASGNTGAGTTSSANYAVATARPTASISVSDTALKAGETATVTIAFSEAVSGLTAADFTVGNGALSEPVTIDDGMTWTATLTPTSTIEDTTNSVTLDNTGVQDSDGNTGSGTTSSSNYTVDTKAPTATIALSDSALGTGETATVTITFSEAVASFDNDDVTVTGGTLNTFSTSDSITWTATLTPVTTGSGSGSVQLASAGVLDTAGNSGPASAASASFSYAVPPTVTIGSLALSADTGTSGDFITSTASQTISGTISTALSGSEFVEVSLDNGATWTSVPSFSGTSWSLTGQTLTSSSTLVARVSNSSGTGTEFSQAYQLDQSAPTATITLSDSALLTGDTATVTITFSEAVTGLAVSDFKSSGTLSGLSSADGGTTWTATLTPASNGTSEIELYASSVSDSAGNSGPAAAVSVNFTYNAAPTAVVSSSAMSADTGSEDDDFITNATSQNITGTLSASLASGEKVQVSLNGGDSWQDATTSGTSWTLSGQTLSGSSTLKARVTNGTTHSESYSQAYTLDQTAPALTSISLSDSSLATGETSTVTIVFNEAVTGLAASDFTVSGGTLTGLSSTDNITWTGTLAATASGSIALSANSVSDLAGNGGPATASSSVGFDFSADTTAPTATLALSDSTLSTGETATLTLTLSEAVTDTPLASDFTVTGGTLGTFTSSNGGTIWTATLTPTASATGSGSVTLNTAMIADPSGNLGPTTAVQLSFAYDTQAPGSLASKSPDLADESDSYSYDAGGSNADDITKDDTPTIGLNLTYASLSAGDYVDIIDTSNNNAIVGTYTVTSAALGQYGGTQYVTPETALSEGTHTLVLRARDAAGNTGVQSDTPLAITIDTTLASMANETVDLAATSDSGYSDTDNITKDATPDVVVNVANTSGLSAGDILQIIDTSNNDYVLGQHTLTSTDYGSGGGNITITLNQLPDGVYTLALRAIDKAGNASTHSTTTTSLTIDTTAPAALTSQGNSSPYNGETNVGTLGTDVTVKFSEALYTHAYKGLALERATNDAIEFTFEQGEDYIEYDDVAHTITLHAAELGSGITYTVKVHNEALEDLAGNAIAVDTSLLAFTTENSSTPTTPSAPVLSLTDTHYASGSSSGDYVTKNNVLTVTGLTAARYKFSTTGGTSWADEEVTGSTMTLDLGDGTFTPGQIIVKQYDDSSYLSDGGTLSETWTIDTSKPSAYPLASSLPNYFGLGTSTPLSQITGTLSASLASGDYLEYTTDSGATWTTADTSATAWSITGARVDGGGAIGLRVTDTVGNISSNGSYENYTLYIGDGYAGSFTVSGGQLLYAQGGNDTITINSSGNYVDGGDGNDTLTIASLGGTTLGGDGADTFTFNTSLAELNGNYHGGEDSYTDVLSLGVSGQSLSLSTLTTRMAHFETIQLGTSNTLTISSSSIIGMSDTDTMRFEGDSSDIVYYSSELWEPAVWTGTVGYNKYQLKSNTSVTFTIDSDIQLLGIPS